MPKTCDYSYVSTISGPKKYDENSRPFHATRLPTELNSLCFKVCRISSVRQLSPTIENLGAESFFKHCSVQRSRKPMDILDYEPTSKVAWDEKYYDWWRTWLGARTIDSSFEPSVNANNSSTRNIILPAVGSLSQSSKSQSYEQPIDISGLNSRPMESKVIQSLVKRLQQPYLPSILDGRKLARLDNDQLAAVPSSTKIGGHIYLLYTYPVPFVLRKVSRDLAELERGVAQFQKNIANTSKEKELRVVHSNLIGECYVDGWMHEDYRIGESRPRLVIPEEYNKQVVIS
ncbi:hypothetical protein BKA64DRAFT_385951 [Cadophora sp. MPI-SDFR-AT-0126]|nr:hypothetical protein BKA64DRAFT_385951 [Leotiomycetes sp. MPI-SDFR-AT-0126]